MPTTNFDPYQYMSANGVMGAGQGGDGELTTNAYWAATGNWASSPNDPGYRQWVANHPQTQAYLKDLETDRGPGTLHYANGQIAVPTANLFENMDSSFNPFTSDFAKFFAATLGMGAAGGALAGGLGAGAGAAGLEAGALTGAPGYGAALGNSLAGAGAAGGSLLGDASWGVNPQYDWGSENLFNFEGGGSGGGFDLPVQGAPTNMQDMITNLDRTPQGRAYLNDLMTQAGFPGGASDGGSILEKIKQAISSGGSGSQNLLSTLGKLAATGLGVYGANQQQESQARLAREFAEYGAPYRARLAESYADPAAFLKNSPDINAAVDQGTNATARALSVQGNPAGSGHALQELQTYATNGLYGKLGQERDRLAGFGGLTAYNAAAPGAATNAVNAEAGVPNAIGAGINSITQPIKTTYQTMMDFFNQPGVA